MAGTLDNRPAALAVAVLLACAVAVAAQPNCALKKLFRYSSFHKYENPESAADAAAAEYKALKACESNFVRGVVGSDMGYGPILFGAKAPPNWHLAKVLDFASLVDIVSYKTCINGLPEGTKPPASAQKSKVVKLVTSCTASAPGNQPYMHLFQYNVTTKPADEASLNEIDVLVTSMLGEMSCLTTNPKLNPGLQVGADINEAVLYQYAGEVEYKKIQYLTGYWGFVNGPPTHPNLVEVNAMIDNSMRIQIEPKKVK